MTIAPIPSQVIPGPKSKALAARLVRAESQNITYMDADFPVFWREAHGCWVTDVDDNRFLDFTSAFGVASVGHCHPEVVETIQQQCAKLIHGMGDVHPSELKVALCEEISSSVPVSDAKVILSQSGSDAVESAIKTACLSTQRNEFLAFDGGYHGLALGALDATSRHDFRQPFTAQLGRFTQHLPYNCDLGNIDEVLKTRRFAGVIVEPILGRGGIIVPEFGWIKTLSDICRAHGTLLIADEVFTGWGRTGDLFASQHEDLVPDIMCVGKAMGGGMPISACVASQAVMDAWNKSEGEALHTSTFLGHPLSCAAALTTLAVIKKRDLTSAARDMGRRVRLGLAEIQNRHKDTVTYVRGRGLMLGIEVARPLTGAVIMAECLKKGLLVLPAGDGQVIEIIPPLVIDVDEVNAGLDRLDDAISACVHKT